MLFRIKRQETYSRGELLLRSLFGWIYIMLPHSFMLFFLGIWGAILQLLSFWIILFTGRYPETFFEYQIKLLKWNLRVNASIFNLLDGFPSFGLDSENDNILFYVEYPQEIDKVNTLLKGIFGVIYVGIPHGFMLFFRSIATLFVSFLSFWAILFTGKFPANWHEFIVGYLRWSMRVSLYLGYITDKYPPFTGRELPDEVPAEYSTDNTSITEN